MKFTDFNLSRQLLNALEELGITEPTPIQEKVFQPLSAGRDVVGIAQTGTGKTFAYLLPTLKLWKFTKSPNPQILVVVPTRELVAQVVEAAESLTPYMNVEIAGVHGGTNIRPQRARINAGIDMVVGTPGRLADLMKDGALKTKQLKRVIIDEVDEMLNLGFRTQLRDIIEFMPDKRQHMMFSATMTSEVELVIKEFTAYYEKIEAAPSGAPLENIEQYGYRVPNFNSKANLLELLLNTKKDMRKVLVFAKTKKMANALYERLEPVFGEELGVIHSSKSQNNRFETVDRFGTGLISCLIATDIIARGLDVAMVTHVVNFDLPEVAEQYIHRIGRTGRAEQKGIGIAFVSEDDQAYQAQLETLMGKELEILDLPEDLVLSDELIQLEIPVEHVPFDNNKVKHFEPSGPAFHEKKAKNQKVNKRVSRSEKMMKKYGKPQKRGAKTTNKKGKKKR